MEDPAPPGRFRVREPAISKVVEPSAADLCRLYGDSHQLCADQARGETLVLSRERPVGVQELDELWAAVGWGCLAFWRIEKALANSLLVVGLWQHDPAQPRLVGFGRCIGDGVIEAVVCDVAIDPHYQGAGLGKRLMAYLMDVLCAQQLERASLFADPEAVTFYAAQGWQLEPDGRQCMYWDASSDSGREIG